MIEKKPELRYNMMTGDWVIISPERAQRPDAHIKLRASISGPAHVDSCPFCTGNEDQSPRETARSPLVGPWRARAVDNLYPALSSEGEIKRVDCGYERSMSGIGRHEVVVESPSHNTTIALMPVDQIAEVLKLYRARMRELYADPRVEHVIIFKNHGEAAGSTLDHPHSQIVGTPIVPGRVRERLEEALRQHGEVGECLYCHSMREELAAEVRIVEQTPSFVAFVPYAAVSPYHVQIMPRRHGAYFGAIDDTELFGLAEVLQHTLRRIYNGLGNPHFNFVIRSLSPPEAGVRYYHWYLSITVRVTRLAGFELGTGMFINTARPEESAKLLRETELG
jgi:UDPglucose--hexose-1-phosphate uridylyltransferase